MAFIVIPLCANSTANALVSWATPPKEQAAQIEVSHAVPVGRGDLQQRLAETGSGVVEQDIQRSELSLDRIKDVGQRVEI